ncbi:TetR/AcrR family transcriptional regulator [Pseudonocardia humida]|uniref:TetR/AcrR family transcriptional regulator C-terminal domain-containing protein n=1 Tax=Pseudonocardia humida TaxID=2800819 RepID=A0ABT1A2B9_9PSEU|nr:TetR/AcrR family transcriptional regulator [Pseudonocardia humida]MCO1657145.1 TetR/AcrR family transcriptional regulator C-terminal domain-containing protein [Pseudonocardia humida]
MPDEPPPVIWARLSGQGRGPARTLDHAAITAAAVALADEDGVDAVSMRRIAARMDHSPMALYRHVGSKDDLTELMYDAVLGELDLTGMPSGDWRADLARLAREVRRLHHAHPWIVRFGHRPTLGPNARRFLETGLACVDGLGLDIDAMLDLLATAQQFTRGFVGQELGELDAQRRTGLDLAAYQRQTGPYIAQLLEEGRLPYLERLIIEAEDVPDPDEVFERRLAMVLDGLAAGIARPG